MKDLQIKPIMLDIIGVGSYDTPGLLQDALHEYLHTGRELGLCI